MKIGISFPLSLGGLCPFALSRRQRGLPLRLFGLPLAVDLGPHGFARGQPGLQIGVAFPLFLRRFMFFAVTLLQGRLTLGLLGSSFVVFRSPVGISFGQPRLKIGMALLFLPVCFDMRKRLVDRGASVHARVGQQQGRGLCVP